MNDATLNHKIHSFRKMKEEQIPDLKRKNVDQLLRDLVKEEELSRVY